MGDEADRLFEQGLEAMLSGEDDYAIICKYCGEDGLYWDQIEGGAWRLYCMYSNELHTCEEYRK